MTDLLTTSLAAMRGRCSHGWAPQQRALHDCPELAPVAPQSEWSIFRSAVTSTARDDGTVHQCDVRPLVRGRIEPKHIGQLWRRARSEGLVRDTGEREQSNDVAGRNADKLDRVYALGRAA